MGPGPVVGPGLRAAGSWDAWPGGAALRRTSGGSGAGLLLRCMCGRRGSLSTPPDLPAPGLLRPPSALQAAAGCGWAAVPRRHDAYPAGRRQRHLYV